MSLIYRFQYLVGMTPWERMPLLPIGKQAISLFDREESGHEPPFGRALDLGCGSGYWSVQLARRGWDVTGIDNVPKALRIARRRARRADIVTRFMAGSVTDLASADIGSGYRLILDFGVAHGLTPKQIREVNREVSAVATADATILMYAFAPGRRGPLPRGIDREEIEHAYEGWTITDELPFDLTGTPRFVQKSHPSFYRLRRRQPSRH